MIMQYNSEFLQKLDKTPNRIVYARITALNFNELPLLTIEGRVTQGSINVDGVSAVRRTCSLTLVVQDYNIYDYYWGLNTKFKLEIGLQNDIDSKYPQIIWFPLGIYIITSFSTSLSTNNFTINLLGKDKMCLLNGDVGGNVESQVDFGKIEEETSDGVWESKPIPIYKIIKNLVHIYGLEPLHNIIINDLKEYGLELLEYRGNTPLYLLRNLNGEYENVTMQGDLEVEAINVNGESKKGLLNTVGEWNEGDYLILGDTLLEKYDIDTKYKINDKIYNVISRKYGTTAGYRLTDLVYAGDLIANIGESLTSVLDKIKNMLGAYEYFYDLEGRFIFLKKSSYIGQVWTPLKSNKTEEYIDESLSQSLSNSYVFNDGELITAFNNNPNLLNLKNDFVVWGQRTGVNGAALPIHARLALNIKPTVYTSIEVDYGEYVYDENGKKVKDEKGLYKIIPGKDYDIIEAYNNKYNTLIGQLTSKTYEASDVYVYTDKKINCDWREIIYQMAADYYKYGFLDDFENRVKLANKKHNLYSTGKTGYEQYYRDIDGYWRLLYYPKDLSDLRIKKLKEEILEKNDANIYKGDYIDTRQAEIDTLELLQKENFFSAQDPRGDWLYGWNKDILYAPELLNFWFDILDTTEHLQLERFNSQNIGARMKVVNDSKVKAIYYPTIPNIIYSEDLYLDDVTGANDVYSYIHMPNQERFFSLSAQGISAVEKINELLNNYSYCVENITITTIPIYYLLPNTRIKVQDKETGIEGDYIINKITIPLSYNGTMSISATKAENNLI